MIFFTSDLHLQENKPEGIENFCQWLKSLNPTGSTLVLGGDIFDLLLGNQPLFRALYSRVFDSLDGFGRGGGRIIFLEGNHDLYLSPLMEERPYLEIWSGPGDLSLGSFRIHVAHGDQIDPEDRGYHILRWLLRTNALVFLAAHLPGAWVMSIGKRSSEASRSYNNDQRLPPKEQIRIRGLFEQYSRRQLGRGVNAVLLGHSHLADFKLLEIEKGKISGLYANVGFTPGSIPYIEFTQSRWGIEVRRMEWCAGKGVEVQSARFGFGGASWEKMGQGSNPK